MWAKEIEDQKGREEEKGGIVALNDSYHLERKRDSLAFRIF